MTRSQSILNDARREADQMNTTIGETLQDIASGIAVMFFVIGAGMVMCGVIDPVIVERFM